MNLVCRGDFVCRGGLGAISSCFREDVDLERGSSSRRVVVLEKVVIEVGFLPGAGEVVLVAVGVDFMAWR